MGSTGLDTSCSHWEPLVVSEDRCAQTDTRGSHSKVRFLEVTLSSMPSCLCQQHEEVSMGLPPGDLYFLCMPTLHLRLKLHLSGEYREHPYLLKHLAGSHSPINSIHVFIVSSCCFSYRPYKHPCDAAHIFVGPFPTRRCLLF